MAAEDDWVTWPEAADIVGCPIPTIDWYTRTGRIEKRPFRGPRPTLKRSSVDEFATWWRDRQRARQEASAHRQAERERSRARPEPPAPSGWLTTAEAARALAVSPSHVIWLVHRGRLDGHLVHRRWWAHSDSVCEL